MKKFIAMNQYFNHMKNSSVRACAQRSMLNEQRRKVIEQKGYDAPELALIDDMMNSIEDNFSAGEWKAMHAWQNTVRKNNEAEVLVMDNFLWEEEIAGFVYALRMAEQKHFYFTNTSTAVMENIHGFIAAGCKMVGTVSWEEKDYFHTERVLGIEFEL